MRKTAFLFPGQGAQNVGMGRSFYEKYDAVRQYFKTAQEVTGIDIFLGHFVLKKMKL